jgi:protein TonB
MQSLLMLIYALAQAAVATTPPPARPVTALFSVYDYPSEAVKNGWQGDVTVDLTVGTNGKVTNCAIVTSSDHEVLDSATCNILMRRAKFKPATDASGQPIESHVIPEPIRWRLGP